jgi:hypothetical protein
VIKPINIVEQALSLYFFTTLNISRKMMTKIRNNSETIYQSKKKQMLIMMKNVGNTSGIVLNTQLLKKKYYTEKINNLKIL